MPHTGYELISRFDLELAVQIILRVRYKDVPLPPAPKTKKETKKTARNKEIRKRFTAGNTLAELAADFGISEQRVSQIIKKRRK